MKTLVAVCGRDRVNLVKGFLASVAFELPAEWEKWFWIDPLSQRLGVPDFAGTDWNIVRPKLDPGDQPRWRVRQMRMAGILKAAERGAQRILFLDSDTAVLGGFTQEYERLWALRGRFLCDAISLANLKHYAQPPYLLESHPESQLSVRAFGMGACLSLAVSPKLVAHTADQHKGSWDTHISRTAAGNRVLTSDLSYISHEGRHSGMSGPGTRKHGLDFHNFAG